MNNIKELLKNNGIIAVLEIENEEDAVPVSRALVDGGVCAIELALRTPAAKPAISLIANNVPEMCIGIGTVIRSGQPEMVKKLGAHFAVAPGLNPEIVAESRKVGLPFAPGISTPSELEKAVNLGFDVLKFFPAEPMGGVNFLKSMNGPYSYLGLEYIPLGGVNVDNLAKWAAYKPVIAIGGTWIAKKELIREKKFDVIRENAKQAVEIWNSVRGER